MDGGSTGVCVRIYLNHKFTFCFVVDMDGGSTGFLLCSYVPES